LTLLAWLTLWAWGASPYGQRMGHRLAEFSLGSGLGGIVLPAALFVGSWTLMTVAMMLPTTLPLIEIFGRITYRRADHTRLMALLIGGYLGAWTAFGIVAQAGNWGLHQVVARTAWLASNARLLAGGTLILAGVYQFTPLKYRCLEQCRSPLSFIMQHWQGRRERREAFLLGAHSGISCVGCCWTLMLLMFAVSTGHLAWMLALAIVMAIEKNVSWGRRLVAPLGVALLLWGALMMIRPSWPLWLG
jgi:predicted metal-binding membrane protein